MNDNTFGAYKFLSDENIKYYKDLFDQKALSNKTITYDSFKEIIYSIGYIPDEFELLDIKGDINNMKYGGLDLIYYLVLIARIHKKFRSKKIKDSILDAFKTINNTGRITKDELYNFFMKNKKHSQLSIDEIDEFFDYLDVDSNKLLNVDNVLNLLNNLYI